MTTNLELQKRHTVQSATRDGREHSVGLLFWLANSGQIIDPWWSKRRDSQLRSLVKDSDHFSGAEFMIASKLTSVPFRVEPRSTAIKAHIRAADDFQTSLDENPQFGQGWSSFWARFFHDLWETDNGGFGEVIGDGPADGPIKGPPLGLAHLDSFHCQRTSDPEFPVIYTDAAGDGRRYKLHHTRVIYASQQPSTASEMLGVGLSWLSRAINSVQNLIDIAVYKQEKLGSRPMRAILTGKGANTQDLLGAIAMSEEGMDNQGLSRYAKTAVISSMQGVELSLLDLASLPDGFDEKTSVELGMFLIALAGGFPPRWLWPASTTGATKADAMYSHIAGTGGGATWHLNLIQRLLGGSPRGLRSQTGKFLPPFLKLVFDYQDDEQDRLQADIRKTRSDTRKTNIESGTTDIRVERENMVSAGDLSPDQFIQLELDAGRLEDGSDVLTLYSSTEPFFIEYLDLGVEDPLAIDANDPVELLVEIGEAALNVQDVLVNSTSNTERIKARQATAALSQLKDIYEAVAVQNIVEEQQIVEGEETPVQEPPEPGTDETEDDSEDETPEIEPGEELEEKGFNFGAKVGETIAGSLARGEGGRFANAQDVAAARNELLANLISRLRNKRGGDSRGGAVAAKKAANQAKIGALDGVGSDTVDGLSAMRSGDAVDADTLASLESRGLAQTNADGSVTMSTAGRKLLTAANTGDVDKAKKALADASKPGKGGKKPKGGKGGGKKKPPTAEERAAKKRQQEQQQRDTTFTELADRIGVENEDMQQLSSFADGAEIGADVAERLEAAGFVKTDSDGNLTMTSDGRAILSAGTKGDKRKVLDVVSRANERKKRESERESKRQEREAKRAERRQAQADKLTGQIEELTAELNELSGVGQNEARREIVRAKIENLQERLDELSEEKQAGPFEEKSIGDFRAVVRASIRGLFRGSLDTFGFVDSMSSAIRRWLTEAWHKGARECGIKPDELSPAEQLALRTAINSQIPHLVGFADRIIQQREDGGKIAPLFSRGETWINQYDNVFNQARVMACGDKKLRWGIDPTKNNCQSCLKLDGKVKRASQWAEMGVRPQNPPNGMLECGGWKCGCGFSVTDEPLSRGRMPNLP